MLEKNCEFFREIELANVFIEDLIIKKYNELAKDKSNLKLNKEYLKLKKMSNNLFNKKTREQIFKLANINWKL